MNLSNTQIDHGRKKVLENVIELIEEAEILFDKNKFARAYTLAHLAFEELAKIPIIGAAPNRIKNEDNYDWRKVRNKILNHKPKLNFSISFNLEHEESFLKITGLKQFKLNDVLEKMNNLKNASLYVGENKGLFKKPSDVITKTISENMIKISKEYCSFIKYYEQQLRGEYEKKLSEEEIQELMSQLNEVPMIEVSEHGQGNNKVTIKLIEP